MAVRISPLRLRFPSFLVTASRSQEAATPCCGSGGGGGGGGLTARAMSSAPSPYTTLKERVSCEREIKKSKFLAVAAPISDERSAHSFLSEVLSSPLPSSRFDSPHRSPTRAERLGFDFSPSIICNGKGSVRVIFIELSLDLPRKKNQLFMSEIRVPHIIAGPTR
ncbi:hypothetical protein BHM03_00024827 [Ensete ventricosum]|nr:hypothetical protein BHM03_00024827 [Ensete ventricosum]